MSEAARVLVVANKTAATPALIEAVRERAARGPASFTLLIPNPAHGLHAFVDPEDQAQNEAETTLELALPLLERAPAARIVNVSSEAALQIDPRRAAHDGFLRAPGYSLAKYTMNVLTTLLAPALADTAILINSVDPGETASHPERGDEDTARPAAESARGIVWAATLPAGGPTGGLFRDGQPLGDTHPLPR